jgi:hypothetical protein
MKTANLSGPAPTAPPVIDQPGTDISVEVVAKLEPVTLNIDMLRAALLCVSTEETRPYLNGVFVHRTHDGFVRAVSSDGHRMVVANLFREHADKPGPAWLSAGVIIPADQPPAPPHDKSQTISIRASPVSISFAVGAKHPRYPTMRA